MLYRDDELLARLQAPPDLSDGLDSLAYWQGRRERLPDLYLTDEELRTLVALSADGAEITAQDLPTSAAVPLRALT